MQLSQWRMKDFAPGFVDGADLAALRDGEGWVPVSAPGDTYMALHAAGRLPHPFRDMNEKACGWVEAREWWWCTTFDEDLPASDERLVLVFEGLDTFASIWLNDKCIAETSNMFVEKRIDVTKLLRAGEPNVLAVGFRPPSEVLVDREPPNWPGLGASITATKRNLVRKAQFVWGWDWGPSFPSVGIWRPVRMERQKVAAITDLAFATLEIGETAKVAVSVKIDAFFGEASPVVDIALDDPQGNTVAHATVDPAVSGRAEFLVETPQLWWTHDLGTPALYTLKATLRLGKQICEQRTLKVGIRTIELDTSPDPTDKGCDFFRFVLNGVPIFARGANWIPASSFVADLTEADYAARLEQAAGANMNMIRIWGGGVYEPDCFHNLCDRLGLLVWQDFMFACAPYPEDDPAFVKSVREEVSFQVRRLRHHPSLALWCGNNEGQVIQEAVNHMTGQEGPMDGTLYFERIMPEILKKTDPYTSYWPGSPYGGRAANSMRAGDEHNWTVWHGFPPVPDDKPVGKYSVDPENVAYTRYAEDTSRFVSEFGIQASPALSTFARWMNPDDIELGSVGFLNRVKDHPKNKVDAMMIPVTGLPDSLQSYVDFTQLTQAEGLKFGIEHFRRRKPHCAGALIWQMNDCWPGISWSLVDYDGVPKAGYFHVKRAYASVLGSFRRDEDGGMELWVTNDTLSDVDISADLNLGTLSGETIWQRKVEARVVANDSKCIWKMGRGELGAEVGQVLWVRSPQFPDNRVFFAPVKDLRVSPEKPEMKIEQMNPNRLRVALTGGTYHCFVHIVAPHPATHFSDNYVDIFRDETKRIDVVNAESALDPATLELRQFGG